MQLKHKRAVPHGLSSRPWVVMTTTPVHDAEHTPLHPFTYIPHIGRNFVHTCVAFTRRGDEESHVLTLFALSPIWIWPVCLFFVNYKSLPGFQVATHSQPSQQMILMRPTISSVAGISIPLHLAASSRPETSCSPPHAPPPFNKSLWHRRQKDGARAHDVRSTWQLKASSYHLRIM